MKKSMISDIVPQTNIVFALDEILIPKLAIPFAIVTLYFIVAIWVYLQRSCINHDISVKGHVKNPTSILAILRVFYINK